VKIDRRIFRLALRAGELLRLDAPGRVEVEVESGRLWITEESQARDTWLDAGQCARLEGRGLTLLEATRSARIRIAESLQPMQQLLR
jgi:hypothetical protein